MRSALFLLMVFVCFMTLTCAADVNGVDNRLNTDNLQASAGTLTTTRAPVAPAALEPKPVLPLSVPAKVDAIITTSTAAPSLSAALTQEVPLQQSQSQGQKAILNQGGQENERGGSLSQQDNTDVVTPTAPKDATPLTGKGSPTDHTDLAPQREQDPAPLQPHTTTSEGAPAQQKTIPSKNADAGGQTDKGKKQAKPSTTVAGDMATPAVPTNGDNEINVAQTSVNSTSIATKGQSTSPTTILPDISNAMQHVDKKDNTIGSSSLFALAALSTVVIMTGSPAY